MDCDGWPRDSIGRVHNTVDLAQELGLKLVVIHIPHAGERSYASWLEEVLPEYQEDVEPVIAVENLPYFRRLFGRQVWKVSTIPFPVAKLNQSWQRMIAPISTASITWRNPEDLRRFRSVAFDTTHWGAGGFELLDAYKQLKDRVVHVHLSNWRRKEHRLLDDGRLPIGELLRHLSADGYTGAVCCEFDPDSLEAQDEDKVRQHLLDAVRFCRQHLRVPRAA